jgi:hypothetical protein
MGWSTKNGWVKTLIGTGTSVIYNPCLNLFYCSTPDWLMKAIGKNGIRGGFASRCLFVNQFERQKENLEWLDEDELKHTDLSLMKQQLIEDLKDICQIKGEYKVHKGFKEAYNAILKERNAKLDLVGDNEMQPYYSRKMWHCLKLAQILTASETSELAIRPETLEKANQMLLALEPTMYKPFGVQGDSPLAGVTKVVWEYIKNRKVATKRELLQLVWKNATARQLDEVLSGLTTMGKARLDMSGGTVKYVALETTDLG